MSEHQEAKRYIVECLTQAISGELDPEINEACQWIVNARKVFIYGVGRSGLVSQAFAVRLVQLGLDVHYIGDATTPIVEKGDLAIIVSNTGQTMSAVQTANIIRREGVQVIAVTGRESSKLAHAANLTITLDLPQGEQRQKDLAPLGTLFEDTALILFDVMTVKLMRMLERDEKYMRGRHSIWV